MCWCAWQAIDKNTGERICLASMNDGRVKTCPYQTEEIREQTQYPCSDYKKGA